MGIIDTFGARPQTDPMSSKGPDKQRILELENELAKKEQDLKIYRQELSAANEHLKKLIAQSEIHLRQAQRIQRSLVPTEIPSIQGFDFSTKYKAGDLSGGDYFDIFEHRDRMRFGLFLSSSSGYGISSLFLSVLMKMTFDIEEQRRRDPAFVLREICREIESEADQTENAAIFYGVFDRRTFELVYGNLGQNLAFYHRASTNEIQLLKGEESSFSPGMEDLVGRVSNETLTLQPRDKLVFCSKGFLGLRNDRGEAWGLHNLLSLVKKNADMAVHQLRNEIMFQAEQFAVAPTPDLTVIVAEVKDRIIKLAPDRT